MSINRSDFVAEVYKNKSYRPKDVWDYIESTRQIKFISPKETESLIKKSREKLDKLLIKYKINFYTPLQFETSQAGKDLAKLTLEHYNRTIGLITEEPFEGFVVIK